MRWNVPKLVVLVAATFMAVPVAAQDVPDIPEIKAEDVSLGQVVSFVNAMIAVERVRADYTGRIEQAETEDEMRTLIQEADEAAKAAVDKVIGISPDEYLAISMAAQKSEELTERINLRLELLKEAQEVQITTSEQSTHERIQEENAEQQAE